MEMKSRLGEINPDFELVKLNTILTRDNSGEWGADPDKEYVPVIRGTNFNNDGILDISDIALRYLKPDQIAEKQLYDGDILIERSGGSDTQPVGRVGYVSKEIADLHGSCANFIQRISLSDSVDSRFVYYCLQHMYEMKETTAMQAQTTGLRNLDWKMYKNTVLPNPLLPEQQAIAGIISKVDQCIENVQKSIEATQKLKKSLMQNLLTGRMKPDGTMRKETDFWEHPKMGKVPNGWEVKQVKDIAIQVTDGEHQTPDRTESGYFLLSARNIKNGYLTLDDVDYVGEKEFKRIQKRCHPEENDILISCSGTIGNVCKVPAGIECVMVRSAALVKVNHERINADFLEYLLQSFPLQIGMKIAVSASVQGNLFQGAIKKLRFMAPVDLIEQRDIANILNDTTNQIISEQNKIASLQRLKKSLMQNLLTGQKRIDVAKINSLLESMN